MPEQLLVLQQVATGEMAGISAYSHDSLFRVAADTQDILPVGWAAQTKENNQRGKPMMGNAAASGGFNASLIDNIALVNGLYRPAVPLVAGRWERLRLLNAGALFFLDVTVCGKEKLFVSGSI
jgi:hypothetical protein